MAKICTVKQIQKLDHLAIDQYGVSSMALMENAGRAVSEEILKLLKRSKGRKVCIVCGLGNNAGDGFVVARHLMNADLAVEVIVIGDPKKLKADAKQNYDIIKKCKVSIRVAKRARERFSDYDIVVDAIFGVGLNRIIDQPYKGIIEQINTEAGRVVAVDIPSGLDGTSGEIFGSCIKAYRTVTFSAAKKGLYAKKGPKFTGKVIVADIGIPKMLFKKI